MKTLFENAHSRLSVSPYGEYAFDVYDGERCNRTVYFKGFSEIAIAAASRRLRADCEKAGSRDMTPFIDDITARASSV